MDGRVLQVNVSPGGVPKLPVAGAVRVGIEGLAGDRHRADWTHGGPHRAVCLFAAEAIERVASEGHPIAPGTVGENLTTVAIELAELPIGTRLAIGDRLLLEVTTPAMPCDSIVDSFADGTSGRISILRFPLDSRMYARVLVEGEVAAGDPIRVLPPTGDRVAETHARLNRFDAVERASDVARWRAAAAAGYEIAVHDHGDLSAAASSGLPGPAFNRALGLRQVPIYLARVLAMFRRAGTPGWLADVPPYTGAPRAIRLTVRTAAIDEALARAGAMAEPADVTVREVAGDEVGGWAEVMVRASDLGGANEVAWRRLLPHLAATPGHTLLLAELGGQPVGVGLLVTHRRVGFLRSGAVLPHVRRRGVHTALVAARARLAAQAGCDALMSVTGSDTPGSPESLARFGFEPLWERDMFRFDPATSPAD